MEAISKNEAKGKRKETIKEPDLTESQPEGRDNELGSTKIGIFFENNYVEVL